MKIIQVINTMITNSNKISKVLKNKDEYFFLYNEKHKWSINRDEESNFILYFYPTDTYNIKELANFDDWHNFNEMVTYKSEDMKSREAFESFSELYQIVSEKLYGLDDIFNEIINNF
ncbi:hypothetical protein [Empedobacter falsenii]